MKKEPLLNQYALLNTVILSAEYLLRSSYPPSKSNNSIFFQYTRTQALDAILKSGSIWATNMKYLNDSLEYKSGIATIDSVYSKRNTAFNQNVRKNLQTYSTQYNDDEFSTFSTSFCEEGDLLSQWITYAKEGGVSIGFDFSIDNLYWGQKINDNFYRTNAMKYPLSVMYVPLNPKPQPEDEHIRIIKKVIKNISSTGMTTDIEKLTYYMLLCYIKNCDFKQEREHRIVSVPCVNSISSGKMKEYASEVKTMIQDSHVFRPYIELYPITKDDELTNLPIAEIIVGPASNQNNIFKSIVYKLEHSYIEDIKIEIPSPEKYKERKAKYKKLVGQITKRNPNIDYRNIIHFCEPWGLIVKTSESSYVF